MRFLVDLEDSLAASLNHLGQTAWHLLAVCPPGRGSDAIQLLCEAGSAGQVVGVVDAQDHSGDTVLHCLCRYGLRDYRI